MTNETELSMYLVFTLLGCLACAAYAKCKQQEEEMILELGVDMSELYVRDQNRWKESIVPHANADNGHFGHFAKVEVVKNDIESQIQSVSDLSQASSASDESQKTSESGDNTEDDNSISTFKL